jgi:aminobenzoyl-glutamate transport protein
MSKTQKAGDPSLPAGSSTGFLDWLERTGNRLPDPAMIFLVALGVILVLSAVLAPIQFEEMDPRTIRRDGAGQIVGSMPIRVHSQLGVTELIQWMSRMVKSYMDFPPLGVVLVTMIGISVAECTGYIRVALKQMVSFTPRVLLTPAVLLMAIVSHSAGDSSFVIVLPLGGLAFAAVGRHPVAGIALAFAGVSGGLSASLLPSPVDLLLQGFTQNAAQFIQPGRLVNPLCNWYFMSASCALILGLGWWLNDRWLEPRLHRILPVDVPTDEAGLTGVSREEGRGFWAGTAVLIAFLGTLAVLAWPKDSPLRGGDGSLTASGAPLMEMIVPIITLMGILPGVVHGYVSGSITHHRQIVQGVSKSMGAMGYYLVMSFCAALFSSVFRESNLGALLAIKGAKLLASLGMPGGVTMIGLILLTALVNLFIVSASAKWAFLGPVLVPMLMQLGYSPELIQAAYRIGDSSTNIVTPLMPYFGLVVMQCQRHSTRTGVGTVISTMLPYSVVFLISWTLMLLAWWGLGFPLGVQAHYTH